MPNVLITGAGGGLGLEFVCQYRAAGWQVIAPTRSDMDVTDANSINAFVQRLGPMPIDLLINNAGLRNPAPEASTFGALTRTAMEETFACNSIGPALVTQALLPLLRLGQSSKIVILSSRLGSLAAGDGKNSGGGGASYYAYRISKTAVNQLARCLALDLVEENMICALLDPGWVRTKMGGETATVSPQNSVTRMRTIIEALRPEDNGRFIALDGQTVPW